MFEFLKRKRNWANFDAFKGQETSSGIRLTESGVLGISAVFACVKVLSESIASLPLITYENAQDGRHRAKNFSLYDLLHRAPNHRMTSFELRELMVAHLCLRGNSYSYIERDNGTVAALWPLHPDRVSIENTSRGLVYTYQNDGTEMKYHPDDILHVKGLGSDGIMGYSPLSLCRDTWGSAKAVSDYGANFFKNGAAPGGILSHPGKLDQEAHDRLKASWGKGFQGSGKAHKTAILEAGMSWDSVGISPQDGQMIESQKFSVVEICRIFRVPPSMVQDHDRSTFANVVEMSRSFLVHTLTPWLNRIEQAIERSLLTESEKQIYTVEHLTQGMLKSDTKSRYEAYEVALRAGFLSVNEIRAFESLNNIGPDGDSFESKLATVSNLKDDRALKKKVEIEDRDAIADAHLPKLRAAIASMVKAEAEAVRFVLPGGETSIKKFYESYVESVREAVAPAFLKYQAEMAELLKTDFNVPDSAVAAMQEKAISDYALKHTSSSAGQLSALSLEDAEVRVDEWVDDDHRAEKESNNERTYLSENLFAGMAFAAGFKIVSNTRGSDNCPFCLSLQGKTIGREDGPMLKAGPWKGTDGSTMNVRGDHISPSYHAGCHCYLSFV